MKITPNYIPQGIDLEYLVKNWPYGYVNNIEDKILYVLGLPYRIAIYGPDSNNNLYRNGFVPINIKKLREMGVRTGNQILDYLVDLEVFETDNQYIVGEKSRWYRYTDTFNDPVDLIFTWNNSDNKEDDYLDKWKYKYLYKWFNPNLTVDYEEARNYIYALMYNGKQIKKDKAIRSGNIQISNITNILLGEYRFFIDKTGNRLHTNLTNLRKDLRKFIKYSGQKLVASDLKNSQLLLLLSLLKKEFYIKDNDKINIFKYTNKEERETIDINTIMMAISIWDSDYQDVNRFIELCETGKIYDYLSDVFAESIHPRYNKRSTTKKAVLWLLFDENSSWPKVREVFERLFPTVAEVCSLIRSGNHRILPIILQRIEADIVLNKACKRLSRLIPDIPMYTIHDSISVTKGNEALVQKILTEELYLAIGYKPTIKTEEWL